MSDFTMLINASHPLPPEWEPDDLVDVWKVQPRHFHLYLRPMRLSARTVEAANELFALAEQQGFDDFMVLSAYRDGNLQTKLFADDPNGYAARPGCSEHQTGFAMDIAQLGRHLTLDEAHTAWLAENCWEYGFIVRYPKGREDTTGIPAEPWHLRYVGRKAALEMHDRGWVLEEWHAAHFPS